ncbi:DedA family protein [Sulfurospirillum sp. T05]|uniref:DedA family protein n=1 Tax=Sulfurospirillum tamanense TaxID=2813362 RepID=A0ABS2WRI5_9BACT|nr:DedA family protein [Sulfurospirillum tamanensis]
MLHDAVTFLVETIGAWGYVGIFCLMFLESSFFPFPSEVVMIPAGYLAFKGEMSLAGALLAGTGGSLAGALFNYYLSVKLGRKLLLKYGRYVGFDETKMTKLEVFFNKHGEISTFNGRLIPGVRQYISLPAGLARMNLFRFCLYTSLGASIWMIVLITLGYFLGSNETLVKEYLKLIIYITLGFVAVLSVVYYLYQKKRAA